MPRSAASRRLAQQKGQGFETTVDDLAKWTGWRIAAFRAVRIQRADGSYYHETPVKGDGAGWPDRVYVRGDRILFRELKAGGKLSKAQRAWRDALRAAGEDFDVWTPADLDSGRIQRELAR